MSEAAHALGIGPEVEFRGMQYRLTPWTLEMTALFETWLEGRAFDAVERTRGAVPDDVYVRRLDSVNRLIAAGEVHSIRTLRIPQPRRSLLILRAVKHDDLVPTYASFNQHCRIECARSFPSRSARGDHGRI